MNCHGQKITVSTVASACKLALRKRGQPARPRRIGLGKRVCDLHARQWMIGSVHTERPDLGYGAGRLQLKVPSLPDIGGKKREADLPPPGGRHVHLGLLRRHHARPCLTMTAGRPAVRGDRQLYKALQPAPLCQAHGLQPTNNHVIKQAYVNERQRLLQSTSHRLVSCRRVRGS